jgi:hypothetical protein
LDNEPNNRIVFDALALYQASFEVRFPEALLLWDHAGAIWTQVVRNRPDLKLKHAEPNKVIFAAVGEQETQLTIELTRLVVSTIRPDKKLEDFATLVDEFTGSAVRYLELADFTRVGLRLSFIKEYDKPEIATSALFGTGLVSMPEGAQFGVSSPPLAAEYYVRRDDGTNGYNFRLKTETVKVDFQPEFGLAAYLKAKTVEKERILLDVDCYVAGSVPVERLLLADWIAQRLHVIRRDSRKFVGG